MRRLDAENRTKGTGITVNAVHPGMVITEVTRNFHPLIRFAYALVGPIMATLQKTAR